MPMKMPMMEMYFHFRLEEYLLFKEWLPKTLIVYLFSLLAVFAISALYEALRVGRVVLFRLEEERQPQNCTAEGAQLSAAPEGCDCPNQFFYGTQNDSSSDSLFSGWHVLQSLLHFLQFVLGFVLMLLAMTYNMPVFLVLLLGHTFGYFIAGPLYRNGLAEEGRVGGECCCS